MISIQEAIVFRCIEVIPRILVRQVPQLSQLIKQASTTVYPPS
jgi:hypothetical protein